MFLDEGGGGREVSDRKEIMLFPFVFQCDPMALKFFAVEKYDSC